MKLYTIHVSRFGTDPEPDVRSVPEGFNWAALIFSPLWALVKGYWWVFIGIMILNVFFSGWASFFGLDLMGQAVVNIALNILVGIYANDLARWTLKRRGFVEEDVISGGSGDHAIERYLHQL
jgi:hypothetical protein